MFMFRLNRNRPVFTRTWFLSLAAMAALVLGVSVMAATDQSSAPDGWSTTISYPTHMEMVVKATLDTASGSLPMP